MNDDLRQRAKLWPKGRPYDDIVIGQRFEHHWGRTIIESDTIQFSTLTLAFNPIYFNRDYARAQGHPDIMINPLLVFNVVLGMSVEDCSEFGGMFLSVTDLSYDRPAYPGVTITARSTTTDLRVSKSSPLNGVVTWRTEGFDTSGQRLVAFNRTNMVKTRAAKLEAA